MKKAKEGKKMGKGLSEAIHGDRAAIRGGARQMELSWEDWYARKDEGVKDFVPSSYGGYSGGGNGHKSNAHTYDFKSHAPSCYESHPPLKLPGTDLVIYGGSCLHPKVNDADVYIGFDAGMTLTKRVWPWTPGDEVRFKVQDMGVPDHVSDYHKLVDWTVVQLKADRKVHCGCIGGHGRTGMFLAAVVSKFGEKDAISYVRKNYCKKAVESSSQVKFLGKEFGIAPVAGAKEGKHYATGIDVVSYGKPSSKGKRGGGSSGERFTPLNGNGCIWG